MTNRLALVLLVTILALIVADLALNQGRGTFFMLKRTDRFIEYLAFWR
ncbi:hypothetical protein ACEYYB_05160 [Paracoccus sp. p4-l81]